MSAASLRGLEARLIPADQRVDDGMPDEELHGVVPASSDEAVPNGTRPSTRLVRTVSGSGMSKREKWYTVGLLTLTAAMLYADQNLLAPNLSQAAEEFGFSEREKDVKLGGWLQLAFFVVGSPASLVIGWLADKPIPRTRLFFLTVLIGEGPCLATYWVKTYWQLFAVRAMTGVAVGGCLPLLFSLCGDLFPPEERAYVASFLTIATGAGIALGQIMAGTVGPTYGWRLPFLLAAAPAICLAGILYATVREPERGSQEEAVRARKQLCQTPRRSERGGGPNARAAAAATYGSVGAARRGDDDPDARGSDGDGDGDGSGRGDEEEKHPPIHSPSASSSVYSSEATRVTYGGEISLAKLRRRLKIRSNLVILAQGLPGTVPWGMLNAYFVDYLHVQKGLSVEEGTLAVTLFGLGAVIGTVTGGIVGQRIYNSPGGRSRIALVMAVTTALGSLPGFYFLNANGYGPGDAWLHLSCLVGGILASVTPPNVRAVLLNVNPPETRGTMFAFYTQIDDVGKGAGPALVAGFIVEFGRRVAFNIAVSGWLLCGAILLCLYPFVDRDVDNAQEAVREELDAEEAAFNAATAEEGRTRE
uniref:Major facilitator superfamily (MFS) profile domain-containing protein n=1 Tax=Micromonas pusilla TaxID=38833 RepID=A0A7S0I902_MICPS|mmetsp:Transcript_12247/g.51516  ORF Transcript_12247/g.51516 Transcript_12247/m.51516 type:complete len:589 (+) Transcript_12247:50-1816(+)